MTDLFWIATGVACLFAVMMFAEAYIHNASTQSLIEENTGLRDELAEVKAVLRSLEEHDTRLSIGRAKIKKTGFSD